MIVRCGPTERPNHLTHSLNLVTLGLRAADTGAYVSDGHWESGSLFAMIPTREEIITRLTGFPVEHGSDSRLSLADAVRIGNLIASLYPEPFREQENHENGDETSVVVAPTG
jgi:hypothetical protein